ncbi:DUF4127 family protein [Alkaliphilus sp. B6464]|uniref:DUF4127 family protein n=1 Tax=Alkaliphilus sp. B6464 TaxID=2731219 RepID=UPI001BA67730|nr:DUF4127 family protein [Alkaliphilus sp. B6464]QUH22158.1 DUF4127 family protein [Alkaliphilus sp. B6464]
MKKCVVIGILTLCLFLTLFTIPNNGNNDFGNEIIDNKNARDISINKYMEGFKNQYKNPMNIMLVPLDNRPSSTYYGEKIGRISRINILMPPVKIIGGKTTRGNVEEIEKWVRENANKVDSFIISATMLNHGGLMHSRNYTDDYYDSKVYDFQLIKDIKTQYPEKKIYLYDTIQRLAGSVWTIDDINNYKNILEWAELIDKADNFDDQRAKERIKFLKSVISKEYLNKYNIQRKLNHDLKLKMIELAEDGYVDYIIYSQEDAAEYGLHRLEQEELKNKIKTSGVEDKVKITCGADEIHMNLINLVIHEKYNTNSTFKINYSDDSKKDFVATFEDRPLEQTVKEHVEWFGGKIVEDNAEIEFYIYTPVEKMRMDMFISDITRALEEGKSVAIIDISYHDDKILFMKSLDEKIDLSKLATYSSWNTVSNMVGIGVSHAVSYNNLKNIKHNTRELEVHFNFLYERLIRDYIYDAIVRPEIIDILLSNGIDQYNIENENLEEVEQSITKKVNFYEEKLLGDFHNGKVDYKVKNITLPWQRMFDIKVEVANNKNKFK